MITAEHLTKRFGDRAVLEDISFTLNKGQTLAIIGPSGCGKSTLLRLLCGLDSPTEGSCNLNSQNISMVFQYSALFDSLTVFENVAFSYLEKPDTAGVTRPKIERRELKKLVTETLNFLGLHDVEQLYPNQLSGGMQKRVSFARAIISKPEIIFYDEPTAGLDPIATTATEDTIERLQNQLGATSIVVTHNMSTIERIADHVILLYDGKIQWQGNSKDFKSTDNAYAKQFANADLHGPMTIEV